MAAFTALIVLASLVTSGHASAFNSLVDSLFGRTQPAEISLIMPLLNHAELVFFILFFGLLIPIVGAGCQFYRYHSELTIQERTQTKLVVWALALALVAGIIFLLLIFSPSLLLGEGLSEVSLQQIEELTLRIFPPLFALIPITLLIAILRYRLFDIDVVISRTLVYGPLTAILAGMFAALNSIVQSLFISVTGEKSELALVITTLVCTAAFNPIRTRLQNFVDRYFKQVPAAEPAAAKNI